ncbi:hypothetical protein HX889_42045 [Pseudomonas reactans]|nr:hypothetical protein [Pseudomonas reactans]
MEELKNSVESAIVKRIDSPLFGFIFISWLTFNWSNLLFLFLSKKTIEERIYTLTHFDRYDYFNYLFLPVVFGVGLAVFYPYAQIWLENKHRKAAKTRSHDEKEKLREAYQNEIELADYRARAKNATDEANEKIQHNKDINLKQMQAEIELIEAQKIADEEVINQEKITRIKIEQEQQIITSNNINQLNENISSIKNELTRLRDEIIIKQKELDVINREYDLTVDSFKDIVNNVKSYYEVSDSQSLQDITRNIITTINYRMKGFKSISDMNKNDLREVLKANETMDIVEKWDK